MPAIEEIIAVLEKHAPLNLQEEWDNSGFQIGDAKKEVTGILFALDLTSNVIKEAVNLGYNMIYTHHPLIFKPLSSITSSSVTGKLVTELIRNDINLYCAHTNLDKTVGGVNDKLAEILGLYDVKGLGSDSETTLGRIGKLNKPMTLSEFAEHVAYELSCEACKYVGDGDKQVKIVAVASGGASEFYLNAYNEGADVFVTSEIKHSVALAAKELDLSLIDAGHFETENIILEDIADLIATYFNVPLCISKSHIGVFKKASIEREII